MYILEIIHANRKEDLFFEDLNFQQQDKQNIIDRWKAIDESFSHDIYKGKLNREISRATLVDGTYTINVKTKFFKSQRAAENYWKSFFELYNSCTVDGENIPSNVSENFYDSSIKKKMWAKEHGVLTEANILDAQGNYIKVLNSCMQSVCAVWGTCSTEAPCWEKDLDKTETSFHHIPIQSIKRIQR